MLKRYLSLFMLTSACACASTIQEQGKTAVRHPSAADQLERASIKFGVHKFMVLSVLTNEQVCVEYIDQTSVHDEDERQKELKTATAQLSADGGSPHMAKLTAQKPHEGGQFCVDNDFVTPETKTLAVVLDVGRYHLSGTYALEGGKPREGTWGARGTTRFPNAEEQRAMGERRKKAEAKGRRRLESVVGALAKQGVRCGKLPKSGFLHVECNLGERGSVELWNTDDAGSAVDIISRWPLLRPDCKRHERRLEKMQRELRLEGAIRCSVEGYVKLVSETRFSEGVNWGEAVEFHLREGERLSEKLLRAALIE